MLSETIAGAAARFGDRPAVVTPTHGLTWGELHAASERLAAALAARGVGPGSVVALSMRSGPAWAVAAAAVDRAGGAFAGVSPVASVAERSAMVESADPALVLAEPDLVDGLPLRAEVAVMSADGLADATSGAALRRGEDLIAARRRVDDDPFAVCFTSGTTGAPKPALFTVASARAVARIDVGADPPWGGGAPMIGSTQFAHVGFSLKFPWYARLGTTVHVMDRWRADDAIELLERHRMPTLGVVAPQLALILRSPALEEADLSELRLVIAGGAPSPPALVASARQRLGVDYSIRWSSTESGGVGLAALVDDANPGAVGTVGQPRPGVEARIADESDTEVPAGEVGELQVRSGATMRGYLGAPEASAAALAADGWLRTGDLARLRGDGRIVLAGRRSDMYIRGGYNVHPAEVEAVLSTHPAVGSVAVVARPDEVMGEVGVAVVAPLDPAAPPTLEALRAHAGGQLARHKLPEDLVVVRELPLTSSSKPDRRALGALVRPG